MKKICVIILIAILLITFCACGEKTNHNNVSIELDAGTIEYTIPDNYVYNEEGSDDGLMAYAKKTTMEKLKRQLLYQKLVQ